MQNGNADTIVDADIEITHVFSYINICRVRGSCLNMRPFGRVFKHRQRDPASVNAMKQTCSIVIWHILPDFNLNCTENVT